jgi:uncharacterized RDD family membrane protein YckC
MNNQNLELEYVGFWHRFVATIVDTIILLMITTPLMMIFHGSKHLSDKSLIKGPEGFLIEWILPAMATILFWVYKQSTPGKILFSGKIVDALTGNAPTPAQYVGRYFAYFLSVLPLCLGFIWIAFDTKKQGWHDKLAGTVVVRPKNKFAGQVSFPTQSN